MVARSNETYGIFAGVIGLLAWLWLSAQLTLVAAEVNVVLGERLWPRSLGGALTAADLRALRRTVQAEQRDRRERITVAFDDLAESDGTKPVVGRSGQRKQASP